MLTTLAELFDRHKKLQEMRQSESGLELSDRTLSDEQIAAEEYEIVAVVFCLVQEGMQGLARVQTVLGKVQSIIECTYGHEQNADGTDGERDDSEEPSFSSADIVEFLCEIEGIVDEAVTVLGEEFESSRPVHVIVVYDKETDHEAIYKDGELFDCDMTMYASDMVRAIGENTVVNVSSVDVLLSRSNAWPKRFEDLMPYVVKED